MDKYRAGPHKVLHLTAREGGTQGVSWKPTLRALRISAATLLAIATVRDRSHAEKLRPGTCFAIPVGSVTQFVYSRPCRRKGRCVVPQQVLRSGGKRTNADNTTPKRGPPQSRPRRPAAQINLTVCAPSSCPIPPSGLRRPHSTLVPWHPDPDAATLLWQPLMPFRATCGISTIPRSHTTRRYADHRPGSRRRRVATATTRNPRPHKRTQPPDTRLSFPPTSPTHEPPTAPAAGRPGEDAAPGTGRTADADDGHLIALAPLLGEWDGSAVRPCPDRAERRRRRQVS